MSPFGRASPMPSWCMTVIVLSVLSACGVSSLMMPRNVNLHQQTRIKINNVGMPMTMTMAMAMTASESESQISTTAMSSTSTSTTTSTSTLPVLFPAMAQALARLGYSTPTPIQAASAAEINKNLLLIAPTGSGKTLAYLLPALTNAIRSTTTTNSNVLVVAPTRELAVQLQRDAVGLLLDNDNANDNETTATAVALAVRGVPFKMAPTAKVLVGTPAELLEVLQHPNYAPFLSTLSAVVLDEVDVLLPLASKMQRTSLDETKAAYSKRADSSSKKNNNAAENERRKQQEEKQKLAAKKKMLASKRAGAELSADNKQVVVPTEQLLRLIALTVVARSSDSNRDSDSQPAMQVLAGSATASRRTLDRLNRAMRAASAAANTDYERVWSTDVKVCRPAPGTGTGIYTDSDSDEDSSNDETASSSSAGDVAPAVQQQHTIRAVTVPTEVNHRFISLSKEAALSSDAALSAVAKIANTLKPQRALVFLCGAFAKQPNAAVKKEAAAATRGKQRGKPKKVFNKPPQDTSSAASMLSARKTCDILGTYGIQAKPLHVALGLEQNVEDDEDEDNDTPFLVTFEGSARGLHFDAVDAVFIVGRPVSAASYLHLAGRVGRSSADDGSVVIRPGTVVSLCTKGSATELAKWTKQIGGTDLEELML